MKSCDTTWNGSCQEDKGGGQPGRSPFCRASIHSGYRAAQGGMPRRTGLPVAGKYRRATCDLQFVHSANRLYLQ